MSNPFYGSNNLGPLLRHVICPFCGYAAILKATKTNKLMIRCNACGVLIFANAERSQQALMNLPNHPNPFGF